MMDGGNGGSIFQTAVMKPMGPSVPESAASSSMMLRPSRMALVWAHEGGHSYDWTIGR